MKLSPACFALCLLPVLLAAAGEPQPVDLNGIALFAGLQCAVFQVGEDERSVLLMPGENQHGLRLLAIDASTHSVLIENEGLPQTLRIHGATDVAALVDAMAAAQAAVNEPEGGEYGSYPASARSEVNTALIPGNPGWGTLPLNTPLARPAPKTSEASSPVPNLSLGNPSNTTAPTGPGPVNPFGTPASFPSETSFLVSNPSQSTIQSPPSALPLPDWYVDSENIEKDRIATAPDVISGSLSPWPRTPLTPPGTPDNLVDNLNGVYANHNPDFLHQNWSHM